MTITSTTVKIIANGNGATTVFNYNFLIPATTQVTVIYTDASGVQTTLTPSQYSITGIGNILGGTVTYPLVGPAIASGTSLTIARNLPYTQTKSIKNQGQFYPQTVEDGLDFVTMLDQQLNDLFSRAIVAPIVDPVELLPLPAVAQRANQILGFDSSGNPIASQPSSALVSSAMQPVVSAATLALARTAMGLGTLATEGIGAGLRDDGSSKLQVSSVVSAVTTNQAPVAANHRTQYFATGALTFTLARANTLWSGYEFTVNALTDSITFTPDSHDTFLGGSSGTSVVFPIGSVIRIWTNGSASGTWYFNVMPMDQTVQPQGYLSNSSTQMVLLNDSLSQTAIYYWPDVGNALPIYNGVQFVPFIFNTKLTLTLSSSHVAGGVYDVFGIISAGEPILATGPSWRQPGISITGATNASPIVITANSHGLSNNDIVFISGVQGNTAANGFWTVSATAANTFALTGSTGNGAYTAATGIAASRGDGASTTQLARSPSGINTNAVAMTARNGATTYSVPINQGTYLATISIDSGAAGQVSCYKTTGQSRKWGVWNAFNKKRIDVVVSDPTASWTYNSATIRQSRATAANNLVVVVGLAEEPTECFMNQSIDMNAIGTAISIGVGYGSTTVFNGVTSTLSGGPSSGTFDVRVSTAVKFIPNPTIGNQTFYPCESGSTSGTSTFFGTQANIELRAVLRG